MVTLEYSDERTFETEDVEFSDEHYGLAYKLHKLYESEDWSVCSPIMVKDGDKKSLVFLVNLGDKSVSRVD